MSYADNVFIENCRHILTHGVWDTDQEVRPKWEDGTPAHTVKAFGIVNRYDLQREFPIQTIRRMYLKSAVDELLWIWQKKSNITEELNSDIWSPWTRRETDSRRILYVAPVNVGPFFDTYCDRTTQNDIIPHDPADEKDSKSCGKYFKVGTNGDLVTIQFLDSGNIMDVSVGAYFRKQILDPFARNTYGIGYRGNYKRQDLIDYFGPYFGRWVETWRHIIKRCRKEEVGVYAFSSVSPYFQCLENFLTWVMNNNPYTREDLGVLCVDKDYKGSVHYSEDTCTLLFAEDNVRLAAKKWYKYDGKYFFSRNELAQYLATQGFNYIISWRGPGKVSAVSKEIDWFIKQASYDGVLEIINPRSLNEDGLLPRFSLDKVHSIGRSYGYQLGVKHHYPEGDMDQVDRVLYDLKHNPASRRIMTNMYNHHDLSEMALYPCAYSMTFNVSGNVLNAILNQRSQDMLTANGWNVMQYAVLVHMMAQVSGLVPGELVHVIADAHIYDRHVPIVEEIISRKPKDAPEFKMNPGIKDFYAFTTDDIALIGYNPHELHAKIPVAV